MKTRARKPIRLTTSKARTTREIEAMQADLEGRPKASGALWTREFLASGKIGKQS